MKKLNKKISLFLIFTLIIGMITLNETTVNAAVTKEINILEIESTESYYFSSNNIDGYKVNVEKIGMPEFIGRIDQLNGKYDVIIIGNKGNGYTNPFSSTPDNIYHNGSKQANGTDNHIEYYPENDITNKRAEEIKTLIYSGQLVYMESSILSGTSLNKTKLYSNFKDINISNFKKVSISTLSLNTIVSDYKNLYYENKRPTFELTKTPDGDKNNITLDNRNMSFTGTITPSNQVENLIVNLYIDVNGDSLFRKSDSELVAATEVSIKDGEEANFEIKYTMPSDFIGSLDWKVEVERKSEFQVINTTKNYKTGSVVYKSISGAKQRINVIQVYLNEGSKLEKNSKFEEKIKKIDYDIKLTYYKLSDFNTDIGSGKLKLDNFDMVIIGFDDSFWNNYLTKESSEKLKQFIATGQSVMFTHDTVSLSYDSHTTTQEFRDILGQSRFTDTKYNALGKDVFGNNIKHDTVVESSLESGKWTMGYTKGHIDRYNNGNGNRISTTVYKINSGLISQYPFKLGNETIRVKDTHTQYYQLNLEDPNLVPWYVLHDSYYTNKDARSNYYTYSIGNLTYSGTGHLRDLSSYDTAEIELFINTIVKASRGANNAPTIYALNDTTTEVSSEDNYDFNAIVRDLNGDKVKINEVIVGGTLDSTGNVQQGTGKNIWVFQDNQYYDSGSNFSITIPQNILNKYINKDINITIKAQDEKGAISEKTYKIKPVATPILKVNDYEYKGLVGDVATIQLDMIKQNESESNKIRDISVTKVQNNFIDITNIIVGSNNKINITFSTKGLVDGDTITLPVTYKVGNSMKSTTAKIILYTKEGSINAKVIDANGNNITEVSNINAINNSNNMSYTGVYNLTNKSINYNNITSGNYNLSITQLPLGAEIIQGQEIKTATVSYENNSVEVIFNVNGSYLLNELPVINAELVSENIIEVNPLENDEVEIKYSITPQSFELSDSSEGSGEKEVVFLIDTSTAMSGDRFTNMRNGFDNFKNSINDSDNIKIGVVTYNSNAEILSFNDGSNMTNDMEKLRLGLLSLSTSNSNNRNIGEALQKANQLLQLGNPLASKTIVMIAGGEVSNSSNLELLKNNKYNILSVEVECGYPSQHSNESLKNIHTQLGGVITNESYMKNIDEHNQSNNGNGNAQSHNNNGLDQVIKSIPDKIKNMGISSTTYAVEDAKLYFDLNDNFTIVESDNIYSNLVNITGNKYYLPINKIEYTSSETKNENGKYTYTSTAFEVSFKVKVKEDKLGQVTFAENIDNIINNYMQYSLFSGNLTEKLPIDTPIMNVNKKISINANLISTIPNYPYLDDDITVTYEIDPKDFIKENTGDILLEYATLIFNLGNDFILVEGQEGITTDDTGNIVLNLADKIKYSYDITSNKYTSEKFNISFKVKANRVGENITFSSSKIKYNNILASEYIESYIESPIITVRNSSVVPEYTGSDIRILEIEPADSFKLTNNSSGKATTGIEPDSEFDGSKEYIIETVGDKEYKVEIVHMTMPEFIGKVDDLNGKYDVIVVGRYIDSDLKLPNESEEVSREGTYWFRDYMLLENDITNKKANEIREFIKSGQLVYLDSGIANKFGEVNGINYVKDDKNKITLSKLANLFNDSGLSNYSNLIKNRSITSNDDNTLITISNIVNEYHQKVTESSELKRPIIVSSSPESDSFDDDLGLIYRRNMLFKIKQMNLSSNEQVTVNLYLDIDGDGLFKEQEIVKTVENVLLGNSEFKLEYDFYSDNPEFIGYLDWRIEVVKPKVSSNEESIKSYYDGNILFRRVSGEPRTVKVLQISPFDNGYLNDKQNSTSEGSAGNNKPTNDVGNLNLATNKRFQKILKLERLKDYNIDIDVISYQDFYEGNFDLLNSDYDMVIMGFADTYNDVGSNFNDEAIKRIEKYLDKGLGIMLTHDTIYYKKDKDITSEKDTSMLTRRLRDLVGQSRYIDPNNEDNISITHDYDKPGGNKQASIGSTLWRRYDNESNSKEVYKVNESLLTNYPFKLEETIEVRRTHAQWLQLNLEDEDVVPVFTLTENNGDYSNVASDNYKTNYVNKYDTRNSYYTYSKGNITFSGTGETRRDPEEYPESELKLFVNTIIKAERGANHRPTITALENVTEVPINSNLTFNAIVRDVDGDKVKINKILLDGKDISNQVYTEAENKIPSELKDQGSQFPISIPVNLLKLNEEMTITIEAEDARGAISTKDYVITPVNDAMLTSDGLIINALVNENVDFKIPLVRNNDTEETSISIGEITEESINGIVNLRAIKVEKIAGEFYLTGQLTPLTEKVGSEIPINISYTNGTSNNKEIEVKIILNSKLATVNVSLKGNGSINTGLTPKISLVKVDNSRIYESNINAITGTTKFTTIESGKYKVSTSEVVGYSISQVKIGDKIVSIDDAKFDINFDNPIINIEISIISNVSDLTHGLYEGISNEKIVNENVNGFEIAAGMNVNFGSTFILGGNSTDVKLTLDSLLDKFNDGEEVNKNNIKVYKIVENNGEITLSEFLNESLEVKRVNSEYTIKIKDVIQSNTKILITYSAKIPDNSINKAYINNIDISGTSKGVKVYTRDTGDKPAYLPDLF